MTLDDVKRNITKGTLIGAGSQSNVHLATYSEWEHPTSTDTGGDTGQGQSISVRVVHQFAVKVSKMEKTEEIGQNAMEYGILVYASTHCIEGVAQLYYSFYVRLHIRLCYHVSVRNNRNCLNLRIARRRSSTLYCNSGRPTLRVYIGTSQKRMTFWGKSLSQYAEA